MFLFEIPSLSLDPKIKTAEKSLEDLEQPLQTLLLWVSDEKCNLTPK